MRDTKTEQFLTHGGWSYIYDAAVLISEIDLKLSRENPARWSKRLDEDRVEQYMIRMGNGIEFPAIVLMRLAAPTQDGKLYIVATGMHRLEAELLADKQSFDAYIVSEPDAYRCMILTRQLNTIEGRGVTVDDQVTQIIDIHREFPDHSLKSLAEEWELKLARVQAAWRAEEVRTRARELGFEIDRMPKMSPTLISQMQGIHANRVLRRVLEFAHNNNPSASILEELIRNVKKCRDDDQAITLIEKATEIEKQRAKDLERRHARTKPTEAVKLLANARKLYNQVARGLEKLYLPSLTDLPAARVQFEELALSAKRLLAEIDRIQAIRAAAA